MNVHEELGRYKKAAAMVRVLNKLGADQASVQWKGQVFWDGVAQAARIFEADADDKRRKGPSAETIALVTSLLPESRS